MRGFVTNKAGIAWIIGILILSMALFTNVDLTLAGDKKATSRLDGKGVKVVDAETGFDGLEWLKLYKSNGWETKEYAGSVAVQAGIDAVQWSPELKVLHKRFSEQARINELRDSRWKILKAFRNSRKVSELSMSKKSTGLGGAYAAGTTTILLNGTNPATINVGDPVVVTISLAGDTAFVNVYWDANGDQEIDAGDFDMFEGEDDNFIVDNGFEDEDLTVGIIRITLNPSGFEDDDFLLLADNGFLFRADDGTAADTAALWINSVPTGFSVSGTVGGPHEDVIMFAESCLDEFCFDFGQSSQNAALATTDASGNYTLHLPTDQAGYWLVGAFDAFGVTGGLFPSPSFTILFVTGDEVGVDFNFITGDATIDVTLKDGLETAIPNIRIFAFSDNFDIGVEETTDASGSVSFNVVGGDWFVFPDEDDLLGNYLVPFTEHIFLPPGGMTSIDMVAHAVDGTITGVTYLDDVATSGIVVRATSDLGFSKTTSAMNVTAGDYSVDVSSAADSPNNGYCVSACHLSMDQFVVTDFEEVQTGAANIDIYVSSAEGYIEGTVFDKDTGDPIEFAGVCASDDSTDGDFNCTGTGPGGSYLLPVLNGTYTVFAFAEGFMPDFVSPVTVNNNTVAVDFFLEQGAGFSLPDVMAVIDIPNDQGRQVRVIWNAASLDFTDVEFYTLWRLVIDMGEVPPAAAPSETQILISQELWDYIDEIPDVGFPEYSYVAPTLGDSISPTEIWWSTFMVRAHTEFGEEFLTGFHGEGYSVDNLIPDAPNLSGMLVSAGNELTWTEIVNEEAKYYTVYRSVNGGDFQPVENT
ncbi:MAG: carboxypeptidase regulatory-like domain-containing protein, partial [Candidatus Marinimicrobia bacterium]|nr:carboxypeptidase regulatory-like domain-containing protein [Candidatus Neomarinimicrobiota bacterium]